MDPGLEVVYELGIEPKDNRLVRFILQHIVKVLKAHHLGVISAADFADTVTVHLFKRNSLLGCVGDPSCDTPTVQLLFQVP